jgi:hypothetical protein
MTLPSKAEALINDRTGKYFILLESDLAEEGKVKVINPVGDILDVTVALFRTDEPEVIQSSDFGKFFSEVQINKLATWDIESVKMAERQRSERAARASQQTSVKTSRAPRSGSSRREGIIDKSSSSTGKRAKIEWESDGLVFYRHKIETLGANDVFAVSIKGKGRLQMSKAEFKRVFNNIIMSPEYRSQGIYRYENIPEEALPFIK